MKNFFNFTTDNIIVEKIIELIDQQIIILKEIKIIRKENIINFFNYFKSLLPLPSLYIYKKSIPWKILNLNKEVFFYSLYIFIKSKHFKELNRPIQRKIESKNINIHYIDYELTENEIEYIKKLLCLI